MVELLSAADPQRSLQLVRDQQRRIASLIDQASFAPRPPPKVPVPLPVTAAMHTVPLGCMLIRALILSAQVVKAHHTGFNRALHNYSDVLKLFSEGQGDIQVLKDNLEEAKTRLGEAKELALEVPAAALVTDPAPSGEPRRRSLLRSEQPLAEESCPTGHGEDPG